MAISSTCSGEITIITIDRPEVRNAVDRPTADALEAAFAAFDDDAFGLEETEGVVLEEAAELPAGAAAPLADGSAPEGYSVKGNADSGLYHEPDGRWYDATVAEFWFKSGADAEAAGFKKAGSRAKAAAKDGEDAK